MFGLYVRSVVSAVYVLPFPFCSLFYIITRALLCFLTNIMMIYRVTQKSRYQIIKKSYQIVLKPVNEIRCIRQIKVAIKHYNIIR